MGKTEITQKALGSIFLFLFLECSRKLRLVLSQLSDVSPCFYSNCTCFVPVIFFFFFKEFSDRQKQPLNMLQEVGDRK